MKAGLEKSDAGRAWGRPERANLEPRQKGGQVMRRGKVNWNENTNSVGSSAH